VFVWGKGHRRKRENKRKKEKDHMVYVLGGKVSRVLWSGKEDLGCAVFLGMGGGHFCTEAPALLEWSLTIFRTLFSQPRFSSTNYSD
jgi:hypothetical protein